VIERLRRRYLDLIRHCLTGLIYDDPPLAMPAQGGALAFERAAREIGMDWPSRAHSMIGEKRMRQLQDAAESVIAEGIAGDFIETGVWRGGACILLRAVLEAYEVRDRRVFVADSFAGLPPPDPARYPADAGAAFHEYDALAVSAAEVRRNFERYGLLDDRVRFLPGWFHETLPTAPIERLALIRLDGDMYESTQSAIRALYPKLSPGGYCIVDDYYSHSGARQACTEYRDQHNIVSPIHQIDWSGAYWRQT